ncbi:DUF4349 domain-containing protein [Candidatus Woesearchaeota archaeon]|nr:DUF4349 domain-containing protein [Candidatus Woesearchaeota archaeon]
MTMKDQLVKIKENWLMLILVLAVIVFLKGGNIPMLPAGVVSEKFMAADASYSRAGYGFLPPVGIQEDFAPDVSDRKITKSSSISIETPTGRFGDAESKLKSIVRSSGSYLLNENVNKYDSGWKSYYGGSYQIKVDSKKYNDVVAQLKGIGEVKSFNENAEDITASYKNLQIEIDAEKQKLERYKKMYEEATLIADKLQLSDRIFEQERMIKYLEDSLKNASQRVEYSTVYASLNEKRSEYADIVFVKFSELVSSLIASINSLLKLIFVALPYAAAAALAWIAVRFFKKGNQKK